MVSEIGPLYNEFLWGVIRFYEQRDLFNAKWLCWQIGPWCTLTDHFMSCGSEMGFPFKKYIFIRKFIGVQLRQFTCASNIFWTVLCIFFLSHWFCFRYTEVYMRFFFVLIVVIVKDDLNILGENWLTVIAVLMWVQLIFIMCQQTYHVAQCWFLYCLNAIFVFWWIKLLWFFNSGMSYKS